MSVQVVDEDTLQKGTDEYFSGTLVEVELVDLQVQGVELVARVQLQDAVLQFGIVYALVGADEVVCRIGLQDAGDVFVQLVADVPGVVVAAIIQVYLLAGTEPYLAFLVHVTIAHGRIVFLFCLFGKLVHQLETVVLAFVAEDAALLSYFPQHPVGVQVEPVQVDGRVEFLFAVHQLVVFELLSVVAVDAFGGEEPHVAFPVFFDGIHLPVAQSVFHTYIFIGLRADEEW